jgi:hypothetical protein
MGLFDRKKAEKNSAPAHAPERVPAPNIRPGGTSQRFGIDRAIQLMRSLPADQNAALVAKVIASTLTSLDMKVADIIDDATALQKDLESKIGSIKTKNAGLEKEIERGDEEIVKLEAALTEATSVKERLQLAHPGTPAARITSTKTA